MFGKIGTTELILILVVALLIFGPSKLPAMGKMVGEAFGKLRRYTNSDNWDEFLDDDDEEEAPKKKAAAKKEEPAAPVAEEADAPAAEPAPAEPTPAVSAEAVPVDEESAEQAS